MCFLTEQYDPFRYEKTHPHSILQVPTTQLAKMSIDPKFVELTADVLELFIIKIKIHSSCWEIEYFVKTHLCKLCGILRSRVLRVACTH